METSTLGGERNSLNRCGDVRVPGHDPIENITHVLARQKGLEHDQRDYKGQTLTFTSGEDTTVELKKIELKDPISELWKSSHTNEGPIPLFVSA